MKKLPSIDELNAMAPQSDATVRTGEGVTELPSLAELNGTAGTTSVRQQEETGGELPTLAEMNGKSETTSVRQQERTDEELPSLAELNGELPSLAELNGKAGEKAQKKDLGILETMRTEKEAELGRKMGGLEAAARYTPVVGKVMDADEKRKEAVERRLATGDFRDSLEATKLAMTIDVPQDELRKINAETRGDDAAMRERFAGLTKERYAQRLAARMEAGQKLKGNELSWLEKAGKGLLGGASVVAEFSNPVTMALSTAGNIISRADALEKSGETGEKVWLKAIAGGVAEQQIWASPVVGHMFKAVGGKIVKTIPGAEKLLGAAKEGITGAAEAVTKKLGESEAGRLLMKTGEVLGKVDEKLHFGSLSKMIMKTRLTEFADEVVGLNYVGEDTAGKRFGDWFKKCISIEDNAELLTGIIGIHAVMAGASAVKAHQMEKAFREGRTDLVGEYIGYDQAKKLSNEDLGNIYKLITSPNLTVEKVESFLDGIADAKNAKLTTAAKKIGETLEERRTVTPEMEAALDEKVSEYAEGNGTIFEKIKGDVVDRLQDNRGLTDPDILEEMVAQSARRFNPEARRMKAHDLRGEADVGKQMTGIEEMGVTSWEEAEAEGLTQKDKFGRYTGGARQALNISIHGTEKLKASVRDGKISGDLAEDLLTTAQCELGARPKEEQAKLIDEVIDAAGGDEALARRILAKIEEREGTASVLQQGGELGTASVLQQGGEGFVGRLAEEVKAESIRERNPGISEEEARGAAVEPVETEDGKITTVGQVVGAEPTEIGTTEPKPQTALEGVENAERLKGTKLRVTDNGIMSCNTFPELRVQVSAEGIVVEGLTDGTMAKPENAADAAAVVAQLSRIAKRNGITVRFPTEEAAKVATAIANEVEQQGLAKAQAKLDTRAKLFGILFKTTLGTGVTYDEASFRTALEKTGNGRQFVDNHGNIYGFVDGEGKLHFNPTALNFNTPIHEYGHLALEAVKGINNTLWKRGMELIRESDYYREIEEASRTEGNEYSYLKDKADAIADEALATMIGDRGERLVTERGLDGALKAWLKEVWKAFKGALGVADLSEEQVEKMTLGEFVDTINAELLRGSEFGVRRRPSGLTRREAARERARREEGAHYQELAERESAEAERTWQQSGMGIVDYVRNRAEEGAPGFDLDWETMREIARDREAGRFSAGGDSAKNGAGRDGKMAVAKLTNADYKKKRPQGTNELSLPRRKDPGLARGMDHGRAVGAVRLSLEAASILPNTSITVKRVYDNLVDIVRSIETGMPVMGMGKPVTERNFIKSLFNAGINTQTAEKNTRNKFAGESSGYLSSDGRTVRISTHPTEAECFLRNKTDNNIRFVIRRPSVLKEMTPNDKANVLEIVFNRNSLRNNPEDMARIVHDIARFVATGEYNDTLGAAKYNYSGSKEFIADTMRSLIGDAEMREDAKTEKEIRKEAKRRGIKLNITEIGEPTLTASSTLANANLVPGVNATTGAPGSAYTGESAHPTRGIIPNGVDGGNLAKMAVGGRIAAESLGKTKEYDQAERFSAGRNGAMGGTGRDIGPSALGDGKQKYYEVPFGTAVDKIVKAKKAIGRESVFVASTPKPLQEIGMTRLPIMMDQNHVLSCYFDVGEGVKGKHLHGLHLQLKTLPTALERPLMIIASETRPNDSVVSIVKMRNRKGEQVFVPIEINGIGRIENDLIDAHIVTSTYGRKNAWTELIAKALRDEADGKVAIFYLDKTEARTIENRLAKEAFDFGMAEVQSLRNPKSNVWHSITDPDSPVNGGRIAGQTDTQQFKRWFGDSKIVDAEGKPLVVYHATPEKFTVFDRTKTRPGNIEGSYFSPYEEDAAGYGDNLYKCYLSIKNPAPENVAFEVLNKFKESPDAPRLAREELQRRGYDGVDFGGMEYVAFEPTQVKSATDNIGTFDPANPDIRFGVGLDSAKNGAGRDGGIDPSVFVFDPAAKIVAMGETEQNAGGLAAGIEKKEALRPWTKKMSPADLAKPIAFDAADMVMFWRAVSGSVRNPHVQKGERIAGRKDAIGLNVGGDRIEIVSKLFGVMDASDIERLRNDCKADGFFRNEDADWCAGRSNGAVASETERSKAELDRRTRELYRTRVATGEGGMHYATQVLGHEIGHTLAKLPSDAKLGPVGDAMKTLYDSLVRELRRKADPLRPKGDTTVNDEIKQLIAWWHGQEEMPKYYEKPEERFAELFGIFLTQPESVQSLAPKAYDTCVKLIAENERLTGAYRKIVGLKWSGGSNDAVMRRVSATWDREAQEQYRKLTELTRQSVSLKRDWFNYALNDRFGPMFGLSERSVKAEKARLDKAVKDGAMSEQEAADRLKARTDEIDALRTSLYNWQRQSGGATRLMIAGFDDVKRQAEKDGVNWDDVRNYAHYMRVIELGGRATAHGVDPARAAAILDEMSAKLGTEKWTQVEKTWKAYRAVYERFVLEDPNVREIFDEATNKMLWENKHYVTMKHRMGVEESAEWKAKIEAYRKENGNAWDPCIDIQQRMHKGIGNAAEGGQGFVLHHLVGSFEATEDPIAATMKRAIEIKESAARNHLLKQTSETLRACGVKGVYDTAGGKGHAVDPGVYGKLTYMLDGVKHELIVPKVIERSYKADTTLSLGGFADAMRFIRNTMTLWNPAFINRAYLIDKSSLETNLKGLHKPLVDIVSEALCFRGIGVPLYMANNYLTRFTPIAKTWVGKILWNENTVNHYAYRAQKIARMIYEGKFGERLEEARQLRSDGETAQAAEIEENVAVAREMLKRNVFQSQYEFNAEQRVGLNTDDILRTYGYRLEGGKVRKAGQRWNRFEEEQEACTKIIAYLYRMKQDAADGKTSEADAAARARLVVEQGGTPNLAARGVMASYIENATGFFWNVRKEGALRSLRALKDHPTEWITKNLAQTATPAVLKALMLTGGLSLLVRKLFDDDEEKIAQSWWAPAVLEHAEFVREAMKCVPGYYQRNYNVIPLAKFGNEVVSMRVKYSPEEFALQNAIHNAFQRLGADPTDPSADWSTLTEGMWNEFMPNIFGRNYALDAVGTLVGPLVGINPYDQYRQRNVYDKTTWEAKWNAPGNMLKEMGKNFWNYSPLGTFTTTFKNGQERKLEESDVPTWLDMVLQTPLVRMIPASMLAVTSSDSYTKALKEVDEGQKAYARIVARDILADCIGRGSLGGFAEGLKELKPELRTIAIRHVINGWREYHADPRAKVLKGARAIKDPMLKKKALDWIEKGMKYGD